MEATAQQSQNEFTAVWTAGVDDGAADDVGSSRTTTTTTTTESTDQKGPITSAIESTQWTREDIELAVEILKGAMLLLTLYYAYAGTDGGGV
jgi:hypothetical protein